MEYHIEWHKIPTITLEDINAKIGRKKENEEDEIEEELEYQDIEQSNRKVHTAMTEARQKVAKRYKKEKWNEKSKTLFEERREMLRNNERATIKYIETNKTLEKFVKEDKRKQLEEKIEKVIKENKNMKSIRNSLGGRQMNEIKYNNKQIVYRTGILKEVERFYKYM
ncbi:hypothetical protein FQA39_LY05550 [Lamprigera yunnana]|nr:hypothetical protein FQA39_LY05550 [Lamprigera yunnana]